MKDALEIIHRDHINLDKVLGILKDTVSDLPKSFASGDHKPNLDLLFSIIYYIRTYPDLIHHPKEEKYLFPLFSQRAPEGADLISRLEKQHQEGEEKIAELTLALENFDRDFPIGLERLRNATEDYVEFQRQHIGLEERELLPRAREALQETDWDHVNEAFRRDRDPLFDENLETGFRALFEKITAKTE